MVGDNQNRFSEAMAEYWETLPRWFREPLAGAFYGLFFFVLLGFIPIFMTPEGCLPLSHYGDTYGPSPYSLAMYVAVVECYGWASLVVPIVVGAMIKTALSLKK